MKKIDTKILAFILICTLALGVSSCALKSRFNQSDTVSAFSEIGNIDKSPKNVFLSAWKSIDSQYFDDSLNEQDWKYWKNKYLNKIKTKDDAYVAIESMVESLNDPYTRFLSQSEFAEQGRSIDAKLFGIGVHIADMANKIVVIKVIDDTPAQKSGLKPGDMIISINKTSTKGMDIKNVADMVRGKAGTTVTLSLLRNKKKIVKTVRREEINIKSVSHKMLKNNVAYIRIDSFISNETATEVLEALKKTKNSKGIIIDLRGNHGGLLPNAIYIANMFINKGPIVSIVDRNDHKDVINADPTELVTQKPLVLLINESSASASEILSGALKDHDRAILVGEKTYGKGCVQKIQRLPDGSGINITVAKYLTPNGIDINKKGIAPDYKIPLTKKDFLASKDPQLDKAQKVIDLEISKTFSSKKVLSENN